MFKTYKVQAVALLAAVFLAACGGGGSSDEAPPPTGPASVERDVAPTTVNSSANSNSADNVVINPAPEAAAANKLLVFLPGTLGTPDMYRLILRAGATRGFHVIGLDYLNPVPVGLLCNGSDDVNCFWDVRREILTGEDLSPLVEVDAPNSIIQRLTDLIAYLDETSPDQGWGQYLANNAIDWSKIVMAGHSQGGGHVGVLAKLYSMSRAVYFASPADWSTNFGGPADWTSKPNVTPVANQYGFTHLEDPSVPYNELSVIWARMGLDAGGAAVLVDGKTAPYENSHVLTTDIPPNTDGDSVTPEHGATVIDGATPVVNGVPVYDPVWAYLCFE